MATLDPNEYNGGALTFTAATFLALTYVSVALRTYVRGFLLKSFLADDWLMLASQAVFTASCVFILLGVQTGIGRHNKALPQDREIPSLMWQALATMSYILDMMLIKLSIAVFLLRLSNEKKYKYTIQVSGVVVLVWSLVLFFWNMFQCSPVEAQWDYTIEGMKCVSSEEIVNAAYAISVMTILTDWLYALLPIPMIWNVKMTTQAKATVVVILGLGVFASVATLVRLKFLADLNDTADILYAGTDAMVWTLIEPGVAIIAASLVTIRPLLRKMRLSGFTSTGNTGGPTGGRSKSGQLRSGGGTNLSNGRMQMPGYGPGDLTLVDLEASAGPGPKDYIRATTTVTVTSRNADSAVFSEPSSSPTVRVSGPRDRDLGAQQENDGGLGSGSRSTPRGNGPPLRDVPLDFGFKELPPTPKMGVPPRISVRSETYIIEGKMVGEPPTPRTPRLPPSPPTSPPTSYRPATGKSFPNSVHSEDHEAAETFSQHDGRVGLAVRPEWR